MKGWMVILCAAVVCGLLWMQKVPADAAGQSAAAGLSAASVCGSPYEVSPGETLVSIAQKCGANRTAILYLNPHIQNQRRVNPGEFLLLPDAQKSGSVPVMQIPDPAVGEAFIPDVIPVKGLQELTVTHLIKRGDTLARVASVNGLVVSDLLLANPQIRNPNRIYVGQRLNIPTSADLQQLRAESANLKQEEQDQIAAGVASSLGSERWIDVDLATQTTRAYEGDQVVRTFVVSTGRSATPTVTGQFRIWIKLRYDDMRGPGYHLKNVPYVMYFYEGYGLHGTFWHNNFGTPMSAGCVNLTEADAAWLFDFASVGTLVNVH